MTIPPKLEVFGVERSDYRPLSGRLQDAIGQQLALDARIADAWIAVEDAGTQRATRYLQIAVESDGRDLDQLTDAVGPIVAALRRRLRVSLSLARYRSNPDLVPREIVSDYGLGFNTNSFVTLHHHFSGSRSTHS